MCDDCCTMYNSIEIIDVSFCGNSVMSEASSNTCFIWNCSSNTCKYFSWLGPLSIYLNNNMYNWINSMHQMQIFFNINRSSKSIVSSFYFRLMLFNGLSIILYFNISVLSTEIILKSWMKMPREQKKIEHSEMEKNTQNES